MRKTLAAVAALMLASGVAAAQTQMQFPTSPWEGFAPSVVQCGTAKAVNANSANTDTAITIAVPSVVGGGGLYVLDAVVLTNASISLTTATGGLFTAAGGTGTTLVSNAALSGLTAAAANAAGSRLSMTIAATSTALNASTLYFRIGTAQGAAATVDVRLYCRALYG